MSLPNLPPAYGDPHLTLPKLHHKPSPLVADYLTVLRAEKCYDRLMNKESRGLKIERRCGRDNGQSDTDPSQYT